MRHQAALILTIGVIYGSAEVLATEGGSETMPGASSELQPASTPIDTTRSEGGSQVNSETGAKSRPATNVLTKQQPLGEDQAALLLARMRQRELDEVASALIFSGTKDYLIRIPSGAKGDEDAKVRGLLLMRNPEDLFALPDGSYTDLRGNLLFFGNFGDQVPIPFDYSLALFSGGGFQIAADLDRDEIVDVAVGHGRLRDRFGFLASPDAQRMLECLERASQAGRSPAAAVPGCLGGRENDDNGRPGGVAAGGLADRLDSLTEPDCDSDQAGPDVAGRIAGGGDGEGDGDDEWEVEEKYRNEAERHREAAERHRQEAEDARDGEGYYEGKSDRRRRQAWHRHRTQAAEHEELAEEAERVADNFEFAREVAESGGSEEEVVDALILAQATAADYKEHEREVLRTGFHPWTYPEIGPGGLPRTRFEDPRCRQPSLHQRLLTGECSTNPIECLRRVTDTLYGVTGGKCETIIGPDDRPTIRCGENTGYVECLRDGGAARECAEEQRSQRDQCTADRPCTGDDLRPDLGGGIPGVAAVDVTPLGGVIAAMCREGALVPPCAMSR